MDHFSGKEATNSKILDGHGTPADSDRRNKGYTIMKEGSQGRKPEPSAAVIDSRSVKTGEAGGVGVGTGEGHF